MQLCPGGPGTCAGQDPATACQASSRDVRSLSDFMNAAVGLMVSNGLAVAAGQPPSFQAPTMLPTSEIEIVARFSLAPAQMLRVMRQLAEQSAGELQQGRAPSLHDSLPARGNDLVRRRIAGPHRHPLGPRLRDLDPLTLSIASPLQPLA